ncbi:hypothetical protein PsorP6_002768 [Peronosclerospora sorghi]|uniref:Uncharacterized protein n=1 Tax=Peronosclerospora sorghi TaxID=230839 RepID=A0ACC0VJQ3_9STRA|nr:hypothetical protein PsorP6_002768 [Peronosclerospora sorghi]
MLLVVVVVVMMLILLLLLLPSAARYYLLFLLPPQLLVVVNSKRRAERTKKKKKGEEIFVVEEEGRHDDERTRVYLHLTVRKVEIKEPHCYFLEDYHDRRGGCSQKLLCLVSLGALRYDYMMHHAFVCLVDSKRSKILY